MPYQGKAVTQSYSVRTTADTLTDSKLGQRFMLTARSEPVGKEASLVIQALPPFLPLCISVSPCGHHPVKLSALALFSVSGDYSDFLGGVAPSLHQYPKFTHSTSLSLQDLLQSLIWGELIH